MEENIQISNIITQYDISISLFTDILFQHGIDKIYYYGTDRSNDECEFIHYIPSKTDTFGLSEKKNQIYEPLHMVNIGCNVNAHVDLNYEDYFKELERQYTSSSDENERKIISRIIGLFNPYSILEIPVLDIESLKVHINKKTMRDKIIDLQRLYRDLTGLKTYKEYQRSMFIIGKISNADDLRKHIKKMDEILNEIISIASNLSKPIAGFLKITKTIGYALLDKNKASDKFNPLILNLERFHKQASLRALGKMRIESK